MSRAKQLERDAEAASVRGDHRAAAKLWLDASDAHLARAGFWLKVAMVALAVAFLAQIIAVLS